MLHLQRANVVSTVHLQARSWDSLICKWPGWAKFLPVSWTSSLRCLRKTKIRSSVLDINSSRQLTEIFAWSVTPNLTLYHSWRGATSNKSAPSVNEKKEVKDAWQATVSTAWASPVSYWPPPHPRENKFPLSLPLPFFPHFSLHCLNHWWIPRGCKESQDSFHTVIKIKPLGASRRRSAVLCWQSICKSWTYTWPVSWATTKADENPSSWLRVQLRTGWHMPVTGAYPIERNHVWFFYPLHLF